MTKPTSLSWCRQTRATLYLTPIVSYTKMNAQCDKLVTDDSRQISVHLSWQHLWRSMRSCEMFGKLSTGKYPYFWRYSNSCLTQRRISLCAKIQIHLFSRLDRTPAHDGQTDRQTQDHMANTACDRRTDRQIDRQTQGHSLSSGFISHSARNRSFRRCSFQLISWLGTEEPNHSY